MGQKIIGGPQPNDVNLQKKAEGIGDSLSVHLQQQPRSAAVWNLQIWVHTQQGSFILGSGNTVPPSLGSPPSRTVVIANCPGATGWRVIARSATVGEQAELVLDSSKCCGSTPGVRFLDSGGDADIDVNIVGPSNLIDPWLNTYSLELDTNFVIRDAPGTIRSITVRIDSTLATGTYYLQLWDATPLPANGTAVSDANSLAAPVKVVHTLGVDNEVRYDFNELGTEFDFGACLNLSSTEFTKTIVLSDCLSVTSAEYR